MKAALVGYGYWGPNLLRNLLLSPNFELEIVIDRDLPRISKIGQFQPGIKLTDDLSVGLQSEVEALFIATPPHTHFEIAHAALKAGKNVWCEKPFTTGSAEASALKKMAKDSGLSLWVDLPYLFHPATERVFKDHRAGALGDLQYYLSNRGNFGVYHQSVSVISDLVVHDLAILQALRWDSLPVRVSATMHHTVTGGAQALAFCKLEYADGFVAHITANQLSPVKMRTISIGGTKLTTQFDDNASSDKLVYAHNDMHLKKVDEGVGLNSSYRLGRTWSPRLENSEPLAVSMKAFASEISGHKKVNVLDTVDISVKSLQIIEALEKSAHLNGAVIELG